MSFVLQPEIRLPARGRRVWSQYCVPSVGIVMRPLAPRRHGAILPAMSTTVPVRVTLIGYRACGKTFLARHLSRRLAWAWCDIDAQVERQTGTTIAALFAAQGEEVFRDRESEALAEVLLRPEPLVIATGGGCVLRQHNRDLLRAHGGLIVYLAADRAMLRERLGRDRGRRPALSGRDVVSEIDEHLDRREPLYRALADLVVDASQPVDDKVAIIAELVENLSKNI